MRITFFLQPTKNGEFQLAYHVPTAHIENKFFPKFITDVRRQCDVLLLKRAQVLGDSKPDLSHPAGMEGNATPRIVQAQFDDKVLEAILSSPAVADRFTTKVELEKVVNYIRRQIDSTDNRVAALKERVDKIEKKE